MKEQSYEKGSLLSMTSQFLVLDIRTGASGSQPQHLTAFNNGIAFSAEDSYGNQEPWYSDGSAGGTFKLSEINSNGASSPSSFTPIGNQLFFTASDGSTGQELWVGTAAENSATLVSDVQIGSGSSLPRDLTSFNGRLYFTADDGEGRKLHSTDGQTVQVHLETLTLHSDSELTVFRNHLVFVAESSDDGRALYRWNGRSRKGIKVYDSYPDDNRNHSTIDSLTAVGNKLFFTASTYELNTELYVTKGSSRSTRLVKDINTISGGSNPTDLTAVGKNLYFSADDGIHGRNLWRTNGKPKTTTMVSDIYEGGTANVDHITNVNGELYFAASSLNNSGDPIYRELWKHDPSSGSTSLVKDIHPTSSSIQYNDTFTAVNATLIFTADDGTNGLELWKSNGTEAGTTLVEDLFPGATGSSPSEPVISGENVFFSANPGSALGGHELYAMNIADL